jgi:hypothetical protein
MNYVVEMGSGATIYIYIYIYIYTKFHKDWFRHSKVDMMDEHTDTPTARRFHKLNFVQNKESRLKTDQHKQQLDRIQTRMQQGNKPHFSTPFYASLKTFIRRDLTDLMTIHH